MSFSSLLDHVVRIWRPVTSTGVLRTETRTHEPQAALVPATVRRPRAVLADSGPGLTAIGEQVAYLEADVDVLELDVLQFVSGPYAPLFLEVDGPPAKPRGHHIELRCRLYAGPRLVEAGS